MSLHLALSTRPYQHLGLDARHLTAIGGAGFTAVSLVAARTHLDYATPQAVTDLRRWLADAGLTLTAVQAPRGTAVRADRWVEPFSLASTVDALRTQAVTETRLAMKLAAACGCRCVILSVDRPGAPDPAAPDASGALVQSLVALLADAEADGVTLALRSGQNALTSPAALVRLIEQEFEEAGVGIAVDYGHAHLDHDVADAVETAAEFMTAALLSDNHGRRDQRLVPFSGGVNWDAAMMTTQKVGFSGPAIVDADGPDTEAVLRQAAKARERLTALLTIF